MLGRRDDRLRGMDLQDFSPDRISFVSSGTAEANAAMDRLRTRYGDVGAASADVIVARNLPVFGMNCGSVGFLMNDYADDGLIERLGSAKPTRIAPLSMHVTDVDGKTFDALALNEVSLFRTTYQAVKVEIVVDGRTQMPELICDGVLLSTPAGSTAYNLSAHGPILPIDSPLLALTPISPFRPRRWRGAILPNTAVVTFRARETEKRPVSAVADNVEFQNIAEVVVREDRSHQVTLLFDPGTGLEERVLSEQFRY